MGDRDDEEAVRGIGNTGEGVVPGQERCENAEGATSTSEADRRRAIVENQVAQTQEEEGEVQGEEQEEEGHGGLQRADEKDEGEDEPALYSQLAYRMKWDEVPQLAIK